MPNKISFLELRPSYDELRDPLDEAYRRVMESGWYLLGPELEAFETEFATYCEADHCVAVGSGLDAIVLALRALGIGSGDEVIVPAQTFIATWFAVSHCGATPVGVDVRSADGSIDPQAIEDAITPATRALIPVHLFGVPAPMDAICEIAERHGLVVIEDAAQAHGATYRGRKCGSLSNIAAFSFYPGKNLGAFSDGGCVTTNDSQLADQIRALRNYGTRKKYYHECLGTNSRLDELQAAFLRVKLKHLDEWNCRRKDQANRYYCELKDFRRCNLLDLSIDIEPSWHLFPIFVENRDEVRQALAAHGICTLIHYPIAPPFADAYPQHGKMADEYPIAKSMAAKELSLPIGPHIKEGCVERVCRALGKALET